METLLNIPEATRMVRDLARKGRVDELKALVVQVRNAVKEALDYRFEGLLDTAPVSAYLCRKGEKTYIRLHEADHSIEVSRVVGIPITVQGEFIECYPLAVFAVVGGTGRWEAPSKEGAALPVQFFGSELQAGWLPREDQLMSAMDEAGTLRLDKFSPELLSLLEAQCGGV